MSISTRDFEVTADVIADAIASLDLDCPERLTVAHRIGQAIKLKLNEHMDLGKFNQRCMSGCPEYKS